MKDERLDHEINKIKFGIEKKIEEIEDMLGAFCVRHDELVDELAERIEERRRILTTSIYNW